MGYDVATDYVMNTPPQGPRSKLVELLKADIESHDSMLFTTPHLSRIRHKEAELLALILEENRVQTVVDAVIKSHMELPVGNVCKLDRTGFFWDPKQAAPLTQEQRHVIAEHERCHLNLIEGLDPVLREIILSHISRFEQGA